MKKDLEEKVAVTLARFDEAVKQSSTRRRSGPTAPQHLERRELDLAEGIAAETDGESPAGTDKPRCRPWDYEGFITRQKTFTPLNWFSKPASASPPVCARYGWINTERDTLSCECCGAQLRFSDGIQATTSSSGGSGDDASAGADAGGAAQPASTSSFSSRLKSQHHDLCPWKGNACPKEFLQLPPMAPEDLLAEFVSRLKSLEPLITAATLPEVSLPSSFEEHCPGGLSTLAATTRIVLAQHASLSSSSSSSSPSSAAAAEAPGGSANVGARSGGNKRQRDADDGGCASDGGGLSAYRDEVLGTASAVALFGWGSANAAAAAATASSTAVVDGGAGGDGGASPGLPKKAPVPYRLCCALCNRRLVTDNFLTIDVGPGLDADVGVAASQPAAAAAAASDGGGGSGRSGKRRRLSGGGTPLKQMDLTMEHRSFCPWAAVHPPEEGEEVVGGEGEGAVPGWRQPLEALLNSTDPAEQLQEQQHHHHQQQQQQQQEQGPSNPKVVEGFGDMETGGKAEEALPKVQKVLGVLMRY